MLIAIDHYFKCCEALPVKEHDVCIAAKFSEDEVICKYGVPTYILTNNGNEWMKEFFKICGLWHHTSVYCPCLVQCNGMVEHLIKTIKHRLTVMATTNIQD